MSVKSRNKNINPSRARGGFFICVYPPSLLRSRSTRRELRRINFLFLLAGKALLLTYFFIFAKLKELRIEPSKSKIKEDKMVNKGLRKRITVCGGTCKNGKVIFFERLAETSGDFLGFFLGDAVKSADKFSIFGEGQWIVAGWDRKQRVIFLFRRGCNYICNEPQKLILLARKGFLFQAGNKVLSVVGKMKYKIICFDSQSEFCLVKRFNLFSDQDIAPDGCKIPFFPPHIFFDYRFFKRDELQKI